MTFLCAVASLPSKSGFEQEIAWPENSNFLQELLLQELEWEKLQSQKSVRYLEGSRELVEAAEKCSTKGQGRILLPEGNYL